MKGIKGSGTRKLTGTADGGTEYSSSGEYTLAGGTMAKQESNRDARMLHPGPF